MRRGRTQHELRGPINALVLLFAGATLTLGCGLAGCTLADGPIVVPEPLAGDAQNTPPQDAEPAPDAASPLPAELSIDSWDPPEGRTSGGELVVLTGHLFEPGSKVFFGARPSPEVTVYSDVIIHARTPSHQAGIVDLRVVSPSGAEAHITQAFVFRDALSVTAVEPASGPFVGGNPITIRGDGFDPNTKLLIGGRLALGITVVDRHTLNAITPAGSPGPASVLVATGLTSDALYHAYRYTRPPTIQTVSPLSGDRFGTTQITVIGQAFAPDARVFVGGAEATVITNNGLSIIEISVAGGPEGPADIAVETPDGLAIAPGAFTFTDEPPNATTQLLNVQPPAGSRLGGEEVTLIAYGLTTLPDTQVTFGDTPAALVSVDPGTHRVVVQSPAGAAGPVDITLTTSLGQTTLTGAYTYTAAPTLFAISPTQGSATGGDTVTVTGQNLNDADLFLGALPLQVLARTDSEITARTPLGSPGINDLRAVAPGGADTLADAFEYLPTGGPALYGITPSYGAIAGNTLVHIYGAGFGPATRVRFANKFLGQVTLVSPSELQIRTPKASEPVALDVTIEHGATALTLVDGFSYFDPYSPYGGSWGPPIRGTVNITVLDIYTTEPIPEAFVILWADPNTPYQGFADSRGQITFSGPGLDGAQMVTASKAQHTTMSVVEYDAENVTVHLIPINPPSPPSPGGGGGAILPFGQLEGTVSGLGKYISIPPQTCSALGQKGLTGPGQINCLPCAQDADCGADAACLNVADQGTFCAQACLSQSDCPVGWICGGGGAPGLSCIPDPGVRAAWCQTTNHTLWEMPPEPDFPADKAWTDPQGRYSMKSRLGELAVICVGGVLRDPQNPSSFKPLVMGVARHVEPVPGDVVTGVDIQLSIPLNRDVPLRLDGAPLAYPDPQSGLGLPTTSTLDIAWDFGSDGVWWTDTLTGIGTDRFTLAAQPPAFADDLEGVTYIFRAVVRGGEFGESGTQSYGVSALDPGRLFAFQDGAWSTIQAGLPGDLHGLAERADGELFGVGQAGLISHGKNGAWFPQASPLDVDLNAVATAGPDAAIAVGADGMAAVFDGAIWSAEDTGLGSPLYAISMPSKDYAVAAGLGVVAERVSDLWTALPEGPLTTLRGVWAKAPSDIWAVGDDGRLWRWSGVWQSTEIAPGIPLRAIAANADHVVVVGALGTVLDIDPATLAVQQHDVPTVETLNAVALTSDGHIFVAGARGTLLHYDTNGWALTTSPEFGGDLRAIAASNTSGLRAVAAGTRVVSLGPMLSFPQIGAPSPNGGALGAPFSYFVDWSALPSASPTFNFIQMAVINGGNAFPLWWTVLNADSWDVTFPNLLDIKGINPWLVPGPILLQVNRVLKPGTTVDNFDFFDFYDQRGWKSWSADGVFFTPL